MLGKRSDQRGLWEADHLYLDLVGRDSFYGPLAGLRGWLFRDGDFAALYCRENGRSSVPPGLLATALLLQAHDRVSDAEAHRRATVELSWKVALEVEVRPHPEQLCWMSSLQGGRMVFDPGFLGLDHGIENGEQFAHGRDESDLFGFADFADARALSAQPATGPDRGRGPAPRPTVAPGCGPAGGGRTPQTKGEPGPHRIRT